MNSSYRFLIYAMSFLSGAAALLYEICWFRSLGLVFGGTQLAVTTTVAVFMAGLALGNWLAARHIQRFRNLLILYGSLEIGIGVFALVFLAMMKVYPALYIPLARIAPESLVYRTCLRVGISTAAMIVPAAFMGATIPVLTSCISRNAGAVPRSLSFLYGFNTLGSVAGAAATGFLFLRVFPVSAVMLLAAAINITIGLVSLALRPHVKFAGGIAPQPSADGDAHRDRPLPPAVPRMVLWGIGISGFCALGYEVLWTRILVLFLGATVYSFTLILISFLLGIGCGSAAYGMFDAVRKARNASGDPYLSATGFGIAQILIGCVTLLIMQYLLDIPAYSTILQHFLFRITGGNFLSRQAANLLLSLAFLTAPAFLMGLSVPLAGKVHAGWRRSTGRSVGELLAYNTVGSILGATASGFVLLYLAGIERSFEVLCLVNIVIGVLVLAEVRKKRAAAITALVLVLSAGALFAGVGKGRFWDRRFLATYTPDRAALYQDEEDVQRQLDNHEVLYYAEGFDAIVSSTLRKDTRTVQFSVNGRPEASTNLEDVQNQYLLGHLPMLLHRHPRKALVIGAGSGMTLAAVASHPSLEELYLVEMEPRVLGVARSFGAYNHQIIDHPDLEIIFDDARNYLMASRERFDVITADPIHPIWRGSGYLYTSEYFAFAAGHLSPGGIMCQWLPLYLLSSDDVRSVVRTFRRNFPYTMIWLTMDDAQLIGSNEPITINVQDLEARIREPAVYEDLKPVFMGSAREFLTCFLMGSNGVRAFAAHAVVNTDDNVYLEFSSPRAMGEQLIEVKNVRAMTAYREGISRYVLPAGWREAKAEESERQIREMSKAADRAQALYLDPNRDEQQMERLRTELENMQPWGRLQSLSVGLFGYEEETGRP